MNYYFLGIGGIGMSALARFFHQRGDRVSGYDRTPSPLTRQLEAEGIAIHYDDNPDLLPEDIQLAVYTPAIPADNAELQTLQQRNIPLRKRAEVLGELTRDKCCIAVAGTHGKTTTSSMIAHLLRQSDEGCSAFLGGICKNFDSNIVVDPKSRYVVVEADEYDRSFLQLHPHVAVITATDADHLDIYGTHECLIDAFRQFASQVDNDGTLIVKEGTFQTHDRDGHHEDEEEHHHHSHFKIQNSKFKILSYTAHGIEADYYPWNVRHYGGNLFFDLRTPKGVIYDLQLSHTALYNVENAVAAAAVALECGLNEHQLRAGLKSFLGVRRRFDYQIDSKELVYIDDYAHHPQEIAAVIESVRYLYPDKRLVVVFQPHLYTRTRDFADQFADALMPADEIVLLPIYPAREEPILGVTSHMILHKIDKMSKYYCSVEQLFELLPALYPDVLLTLGAGDIDRLVPRIKTLMTE